MQRRCPPLFPQELARISACVDLRAGLEEGSLCRGGSSKIMKDELRVSLFLSPRQTSKCMCGLCEPGMHISTVISLHTCRRLQPQRFAGTHTNPIDLSGSPDKRQFSDQQDQTTCLFAKSLTIEDTNIRSMICCSTSWCLCERRSDMLSRANPLARARLPLENLRLCFRLGLGAGCWALRPKVTKRLCASRLQECPQGLNSHGVGCRLTKWCSPPELLVLHNSERAPEADRHSKDCSN